MSETHSVSVQENYGLSRVCRVWEISRSTVYYQKQQAERVIYYKPRGRRPRFSDTELLIEIRAIIAQTAEQGFHGEGYRKLWAKLRAKHILCDKERVRKLMRDNHLLAPHRLGNTRGPAQHMGTIIPIAPNIMWGTDATHTFTRLHGNITVFPAIDHFTGECVGIHAAIIGNRFEALEPLRQGIKNYFGSYTHACAKGLLVRHDHGSQYMSKHFQKELTYVGIESSPSFVRAPEGNGVIERFFRTLKERLCCKKTA